MSQVKSFSFEDGEIRGDMFYINHNVECFTVIDCCLKDNDSRKDTIISEIVEISKSKKIQRFISTHPDDDHIHGIEDLWKKWNTTNFYCVANDILPDASNPSLTEYIYLKDNHNTPISNDCERAYLNKNGITDDGVEIGSSGISFLWPDLKNDDFKGALTKVQTNPNNICPVIKYKVKDSVSFLWLGDMESEMQTSFYLSKKGKIGHVDIVFAPHHGRKSGSMPSDLLKELSPRIIVIGNAPSKDIKYLNTELTITQNSSGDILFDVKNKKVLIYTKNKIENSPKCLKYDFEDALSTHNVSAKGLRYIGTLTV